ncbi:ATP-dependent RNA helicase SUPV3L1, mitochondrial [Coccomyxa sp. Obi]|nr:ATP-dependent RNA helicase SUPV3L1, mitochondrial [Coccomyxa sp. Obi]
MLEQEQGDGVGTKSTEPGKKVRLPSFQELDSLAKQRKAGKLPHMDLTTEEGPRIAAHLVAFSKSAKMRDSARALYINNQLFPTAAAEFSKWFGRGMSAELKDTLMEVEPGQAEDALFGLFAAFALTTFSEQIKKYSEAIKMLDLRKPHLWYPMARALQRRLVYHMGPTNSGKTYNALRAMCAAESGLYCGPLRLLAMEVYDELNASGTFCNLITGQERKELPFAQHTACTIEMTNLAKRVDVAVIDEIQQIGDDARGWAWTRALQGLSANEIHMCGDGSALPLVRSLAQHMGEELEVNSYERFTPLSIETEGLKRGYLDVQPGDCVVAFSRRDIYDIKQLIEASTGQRVCVVYGALPPEMRRTQARLFNDPDSGYDVLVASDAVGMGLNLNIRRIIFHTMEKTDGNFARVPISISQVKQIAGRAGRRNSVYGQGLVTCLNKSDIARLQEAIATPLEALSTPTAGLFPEFEQLEAFAGNQLEQDFHTILTRFGAEARVDGTYMFCKQESVIQAARLLAKVDGLSLQERFWFCMAPANLRNPVLSAALLRFAQKYAAKETVAADISWKDRIPQTSEDLCELEAAHQVMSLWVWLSHRFDEEYFPGRGRVEEDSERVVAIMTEGLQRMFGPTAVLTNPKLQKAVCSRFASWTNGAKNAGEMVDYLSPIRPLGFGMMHSEQPLLREVA